METSISFICLYNITLIAELSYFIPQKATTNIKISSRNCVNHLPFSQRTSQLVRGFCVFKISHDKSTEAKFYYSTRICCNSHDWNQS
jgi:hypothetical protein